ncbi:phage baseplate protein [Levilactobacillus andaensis]|uniref:phage baseplate protein n=1 Tax=Levilactobacillus andaensis TaxID=2799570 RepID=UPI001940E2F9|nr:hypothetical protein [Levilactobacillus andaensis]
MAKYTTLTAVKKKYKNDYTKANDAFKSAKKKYDKVKNKNTKHAKKLKKSMNKKKSNMEKTKSNLSRYKKSREASDIYRAKILAKMKTSKYWGKRGYIMPKYPWTDTSYCFIYINDEAPNYANTPATNSLEKGHTTYAGSSKQPTSISLQGSLGGDGANSHMSGLKTQMKRLARWSDNSTQLTWHGETTMSSMTITAFTPDFSHEVGTGGENIIGVTLTMQEAEYADSDVKQKSTKGTDTGKKNPTKPKNPASSKKKKRYIVAKAGYTYWYVHQKTGESLATIEKKNKYTAGKIPIGAKIYY